MENIKTISVKVSEQIDKKHLLSFLRTQIKLHNILITEKSYFYHSFIAESLRYEIIVFLEKQDIQSCDFFNICSLCTDISTTLFLSKDFFCIYENNVLVVFKEVSSTTQNDIENYITQTYQLYPSKVIHLTSEKLQNSTESSSKICKKEMDKNIHKVIPNNSFQYFIFYVVLVSGLFGYFLFDLYDSSKVRQAPQKSNLAKDTRQVLVQNHKKTKKVHTLIGFINYLKKLNIDYENIELSNALKLQLKSEDKKILLKCLDYPLKKVVLQYLQFDKNLNLYRMGVVVDD